MIIATIDGTDYKVANVDVQYSLCKHKGSAIFEIDHRELTSINTFDEVLITVDGTTMFTGLIDVIEHGNFPYVLRVSAVSPIIKAERSWFATEYISNGESASSWVNTFMGIAQISDKEVNVGSISVYEGHSWSFSTSMEALLNLAQLTNTRLYPDRLGTTVMAPLNVSESADYTITNYENLEIVFSSGPTRNKAVVFGSEGIRAESSGSSSYLIPGEVRTIAISSGLIHTQATAQRVADDLIANFSQPLKMYTFTVEGQPQLSLNDYVSFSGGAGAITSLRHLYTDKKFTSDITVGEICPSFFGIDLTQENYLYASALNNGVWRSDEEGTSWASISGILAGETVPAIHWDDTYLWALSGSNIYRGTGSSSWTVCNVLDTYYVTKHGEEYIILKENLRMVDIISSYMDSSRVFVVAYDEENQRTVVLFSENKYDFNRIILV